MGEDSSKDTLRRQFGHLVKKVDFNLAQREGEELRHIRATDIAPDRKTALAEIGKKANQEEVFPEGVLTYGDYFTILNAVFDVTPQREEVKPHYLSSPEVFTSYLTSGNISSPDTPLSSEVGDEVEVWRFKVRIKGISGGRKIALTVEPGSPIIEAMRESLEKASRRRLTVG